MLTQLPLRSAALAATVLALTLPAGVARAQVVFSQNFNAATTNADVTGSGPNQFDGILGAVGNAFTVSGGAISSTKTAGVSAAINRVTPLSSLAGKAATFQFDFAVPNLPATASVTNDVIFQVGNGYATANGGTTGAESGTYAQLNIDLQTGGFQVGGVSAVYTTAQTIYFDLNNTGATVNFPTPGGGTLALGNDNFAIFVGNTNIVPGGQQPVTAAGGNGSFDITQFKLRYPSNADNATVSVDNFVVTQVPEPSTLALAGLGLGLAGVVRRRRLNPFRR